MHILKVKVIHGIRVQSVHLYFYMWFPSRDLYLRVFSCFLSGIVDGLHDVSCYSRLKLQEVFPKTLCILCYNLSFLSSVKMKAHALDLQTRKAMHLNESTLMQISFKRGTWEHVPLPGNVFCVDCETHEKRRWQNHVWNIRILINGFFLSFCCPWLSISFQIY